MGASSSVLAKATQYILNLVYNEQQSSIQVSNPDGSNISGGVPTSGNNPSLVLGRNANGKVITITKTIGVIQYQKTLTRDTNDVLTNVSSWTTI